MKHNDVILVEQDSNGFKYYIYDGEKIYIAYSEELNFSKLSKSSFKDIKMSKEKQEIYIKKIMDLRNDISSLNKKISL